MKKQVITALLLCASVTLGAKDIDLKKFGAKADGKTKITAILQKAIDKVSAAGGGKVILSGGTFLTAPVELKSGVELFIDADAVLLGSGDLADYPERETPKHVISENLPRWRNIALIYADEARGIAISGRGTIDCNGKCFIKEKDNPNWTGWKYERIAPRRESMPRVVFFAGCSDVLVEDVTMLNQPAGWSYWVHDCDRVHFDRCNILADVHYPNNDGIHVNCSRDVTISNCIIETGDDSIVIRANSRSLRENKACERVVVTNCTLRSWSSGIRFGWTNDGVMRNCTISNIVMHDCSNGISLYLSSAKHTLSTNDYGREATRLENILVSNVVMDKIYGSPLYFEAGPDPKEDLFDCVRNVSFENIQCTSLHENYFSPNVGGTSGIRFHNCNFEKGNPSDFPEPPERHGYVKFK